jgi:hypothetical protein
LVMCMELSSSTTLLSASARHSSTCGGSNHTKALL